MDPGVYIALGVAVGFVICTGVLGSRLEIYLVRERKRLEKARKDFFDFIIANERLTADKLQEYAIDYVDVLKLLYFEGKIPTSPFMTITKTEYEEYRKTGTLPPREATRK